MHGIEKNKKHAFLIKNRHFFDYKLPKTRIFLKCKTWQSAPPALLRRIRAIDPNQKAPLFTGLICQASVGFLTYLGEL